jgi:amidase
MNAPGTTNQAHEDYARAWVPHGRFVVAGKPQGPLAGLHFAAKDVFDVTGRPTGRK